MSDIVSNTEAVRQSEKRPLRNSRARYDDGGEIGQEHEHAHCKLRRAQTQANATLYKAIRRAPEGWPTAHDYVEELLGDVDDDDIARGTQEDYAKRLHVCVGTIKRCHTWALKQGLIKVVEVVRLPRGRQGGYAGNVIWVDRAAIAALSPDVKVPPRPARPEFLTQEQVEQMLAAQAAKHARQIDERVEQMLAAQAAKHARQIDELAARAERQSAVDRAAFDARFAQMTSAAPAPVLDAPAETCGSVVAPNPPSAPEASPEAAPAEPVSGPPVRGATDPRRLRSTPLTHGDPWVGIAEGEGVGIVFDPSSLDQGSLSPLGSSITTTHTLRERAHATAIPPTPAPGVCVISNLLETRAHEILRHWARRLGYDWPGAKYATPRRLAIVRGFLLEQPEATVQDACDAIDASAVQPETWHTAHMLGWMLGEYYEQFRAEGRRMRERLAAQERERAREEKQIEIQEAAAVVPLPAHAPSWLQEAAQRFGVAS